MNQLREMHAAFVSRAASENPYQSPSTNGEYFRFNYKLLKRFMLAVALIAIVVAIPFTIQAWYTFDGNADTINRRPWEVFVSFCSDWQGRDDTQWDLGF